MNQICFPEHEYTDLLKRLNNVSYNNIYYELCVDAVKAIEDLLEQRRKIEKSDHEVVTKWLQLQLLIRSER